MMGHKVSFNGEIPKLSLLPLLIWSTEAKRSCQMTISIECPARLMVNRCTSVFFSGILAHLKECSGRAIVVTLESASGLDLLVKFFQSDEQGPVRQVILYVDRFC